MNTTLTKVLNRLKEVGGDPKFVGGTVRDHILGISPKDFDIEISKLDSGTLERTLSEFGTVDIVGRQFGVFKLHGVEADFSIPRKDNRIGAGHKDFNVTLDPNMTLEERAKRRDLTMNSMEMSPFTLEVADPFGGLKDMKEGRMRATDPLTFGEDDLRAVRVAQFISRFPSMIPDDQLIRLCSQADLSNLPGERLWEEFRKMFLKGNRPDLGLEHLEQSNLLRFFPELEALAGCLQHEVFHAEGDVLVHTKMVLRVAASLRSGVEDEDLILMFACLLHDVGKPPTTIFDNDKKRWTSNGHDEAGVEPAETFLRRLRAPECLIEPVKILVREHLKPFECIKQNVSASAYRRLARRMNGVSLNLLVKVATADGEGRICADKVSQTREDLEEFLRRAASAGVDKLQSPVENIVRGRDLLARGFKPGREVGVLLRKCQEYHDETGEVDVNKILDEVLSHENTDH